jgi:MoxR-like ATPase
MVSDVVDLESPDDIALCGSNEGGSQAIVSELKKIIVGQDEVVNQVLMTLFVGGNSLIVGAPGLAKTLLIHTMARVLDLKFSRIQFTPDLMPSDITGTDSVQEDAATGRRQMVFAPGPIFANIVLADEINRTRRRRSRRCSRRCRSIASRCRARPTAARAVLRVRDAEPDRAGRHLSAARSAARSLHVPHHHRPSSLRRGVRRRETTTAIQNPQLGRPVTRRGPGGVSAAGAQGAGGGTVLRHALDIVRATRPKNEGAKDFVAKWVAFGASVRAAQYLILWWRRRGR